MAVVLANAVTMGMQADNPERTALEHFEVFFAVVRRRAGFNRVNYPEPYLKRPETP